MGNQASVHRREDVRRPGNVHYQHSNRRNTVPAVRQEMLPAETKNRNRTHKKSAPPTVQRVRERKAAAKRADYYDYSLLAVILLLTCFGLVMLYSTTAYRAEIDHNNDMFFFGKQAAISGVSLIAAIIISKIDYHIYQKFAGVLYAAGAVLMLLVLTPLGVVSNGARRWLNLGVQFQPSEVAKIAAIVTLSYMIVKMGNQVKTLKACAVLGAAGGFLGVIAYVATDNLSTGIIIILITCGMIFLAHPDTKPFMILLVVGAVMIACLVVFLVQNVDTGDASFRIRRILVWLHPEEYSSEGGYQTLQALYAIGSGGFFGKGLGNSVQKLGSLPEAQNDMIFSIVCEELGIFGGAIILLLFAYLLYRLFFIAQNAPDLFGTLLVSGIFIHIALQVVLNIGVVINLIPNTGITLPFVSYGGTSILFLMAEMGIALSVSRKIKFQDS